MRFFVAVSQRWTQFFLVLCALLLCALFKNFLKWDQWRVLPPFRPHHIFWLAVSQCMGRGAARAALPGWGEQNGKTQNFPLTFSNIPLFFGDFALSGFHFVYSEYSQSSRISSAGALLSTKPRISTQNWANSFVCMFVKHYNISAANHVKPSSNSLHFAGGLATLLSNLAKSGVEGGIERDK